MEDQIIYKKRFLNKLDKLLAYLEKEWNITVANEFLDKLEEKIRIIKLHPTIGGTSAITNTRSILITSHNKIVVINMIDTRKNPKNNPFNKQQ
jgi:plasmid stabilization system protein ParE